MYLAELNEREKEGFLELAYKLANIDADYKGVEITALKRVKSELGIDYIPAGSSVESIIKELASAPNGVQKVIIFETAYLIYADGVADEKEQEILSEMVKAFSVSSEESDRLIAYAKQIRDALVEAQKIIVA